MALDFSSITPETAEKTSNKANNPVIPWLEQSYADREWKRVPVPANEARGLVTLLNAAAEYVDKGLRIRVKVGSTEHVPDKEFWEELKKAGTRTVYVMYEAKDRVRRPRKNKGEAPADSATTE